MTENVETAKTIELPKSHYGTLAEVYITGGVLAGSDRHRENSIISEVYIVTLTAIRLSSHTMSVYKYFLDPFPRDRRRRAMCPCRHTHK